MLILLLAAAAASTPAPGPVKTFGDWEVGCDNAGLCTAVSLTPQSPAPGAPYVPVVVSVGPGPNPTMSVQYAVRSLPVGAVTVLIQGEPVIQPTVSSGSLYVNDASATSVLVPMTLAQTPVVLKNAGGAVIGQVSVTGVSAMLRYIDSAQNRAGTTSAFVATGPATMAPIAPVVIPNITQSPLNPIGMGSPAASVVAGLRASGCGDPVPAGTPAATSYALDGSYSLMLVPCGIEPLVPPITGSNMKFLAFVDNGSGPQPANFDVQPGWAYNPAFTFLENASYDSSTGVLSDNAHAAAGDKCGVDHKYVWDGHMFRLFQMDQLNDCQGAAQRIPVWTASINSGQ
ncbi:hypothetical protein BH09PSE4_BH09PSE4_20260 [soil metagenome]